MHYSPYSFILPEWFIRMMMYPPRSTILPPFSRAVAYDDNSFFIPISCYRKIKIKDPPANSFSSSPTSTRARAHTYTLSSLYWRKRSRGRGSRGARHLRRRRPGVIPLLSRLPRYSISSCYHSRNINLCVDVCM